MIRIIRGVYGYVDSNGAVSPKTVKDEPFSLDEEKEARLVKQGVAEYVGKAEPEETEDAEPVEQEAESEETEKEAKPAPKKSAKKSSRKAKADDEPPVISAADPE